MVMMITLMVMTKDKEDQRNKVKDKDKYKEKYKDKEKDKYKDKNKEYHQDKEERDESTDPSSFAQAGIFKQVPPPVKTIIKRYSKIFNYIQTGNNYFPHDEKKNIFKSSGKSSGKSAKTKKHIPHIVTTNICVTMHYRLRSIKWGQFRFSNFTSHFKQKSYFHFLIH